MGQVKQYDREYKEEALKLVEEKGCKNASEELGISYNTLYGRERMHQALLLKHPNGEGVPSESTVYRVMHEIGISHRPQ